MELPNSHRSNQTNKTPAGQCASAELKAEIKKNCAIQLVPPDNHRQNLVIQTFKNHFKAIQSRVDDTFPMQLWDKLLPQTVLTLNLL
jgi:hypothetical protein